MTSYRFVRLEERADELETRLQASELRLNIVERAFTHLSQLVDRILV